MKQFTVFFLLLFQFAFSQQPQIFKIKKYRVAVLSDSLRETSGLAFLNGKLLTINDSGNSSEVFEINPNDGKILSKKMFPVPNTDWEAIAADSSNVFVGDFGNNSGARRDLKIYRYHPDSLNVKTIRFRYLQQQDFTPKPLNTDWDAESLIFLNGKLHIFTKEWSSREVSHFIISPNYSVEIQDAELLEKFPIGFVATDAAYFQHQLFLVGYTKKLEVYLMVFNEDTSGKFFSGKARRFYLGQASALGQVEGIAVNENGIWISAEQFNLGFFHAPQSLYFIPKEKLEKMLNF